MDHSIAAKYAARPAAHFVRASARARERRLGLVVGLRLPSRGHHRDRPAPPRRGAADRAFAGAGARSGRPARVASTGRPHHAIVMQLDPLRAGRGDPASERRLGAVARLRTATATSAGGIVVRLDAGQSRRSSSAARRRDRDGRDLDPAEGHARAPARRPSRPPSARSPRRPGSRSGSPAPLDSIEYWFVQRGTRIHKTVHYFLMEPTGGDLVGHDHEFDEVRWIPFDEARRRC